MKIAIAFASKTGTTEKAADRLAEALRARGCEVTVYNLAVQKPDLAADALALGGSVRMGRWHRLARRFARRNETALLQKPLALFACRCGTEDLRTLFAGQIGEPLVDHAVYADCLGGELDVNRQRGLDRFIVRMIQKSDAASAMATPGILGDNAEACADTLTGALLR